MLGELECLMIMSTVPLQCNPGTHCNWQPYNSHNIRWTVCSSPSLFATNKNDHSSTVGDVVKLYEPSELETRHSTVECLIYVSTSTNVQRLETRAVVGGSARGSSHPSIPPCEQYHLPAGSIVVGTYQSSQLMRKLSPISPKPYHPADA